jgi:hypothetical protein
MMAFLCVFLTELIAELGEKTQWVAATIHGHRPDPPGDMGEPVPIGWGGASPRSVVSRTRSQRA